MARPAANYWKAGEPPYLHPGLNVRDTQTFDYIEETVEQEALDREAVDVALDARVDALESGAGGQQVIVTYPGDDPPDPTEHPAGTIWVERVS